MELTTGIERGDKVRDTLEEARSPMTNGAELPPNKSIKKTKRVCTG